MKSFLYVCILVIPLAVALSLQDNIVQLTAADLHSMTTVFPKLLVFYYLPWCDHCQKLSPIYHQLANQLQDEGSPIKLAKINLEGNEQAYDFAQIVQVPLLKYYSDGDEVEFNGDRTLSYLHKWLTKRVKFPIVPIRFHQLQSLRKANSSEVSVVYHGSMKSSRAAEFITMAYHDNYNHYYYIEQQGEPEGKIEILRSFDRDVSDLVEPKQVQKWVRQHDRPNVVPLDQRSINHIFRDGHQGVFFFIEPLHSKVKQTYIEAAEKWKARADRQLDLTFIAIPEQHEDYFGLMEYLELHAIDRPLAVVDGKQQNKYIFNTTVNTLNSQDILNFLTMIQTGKANPSPLEMHSHDEGLGCPFEFTNATVESPAFTTEDPKSPQTTKQASIQQKISSAERKDQTFLLTRQL